MEKNIIQRRLLMAHEMHKEVPSHLSNGFYGTAINRLYYSCFYATQALLFTLNYTPKTHKGLISLLHEHFVNKGLFEKSKAQFLSDLLKERMDGDYTDF